MSRRNRSRPEPSAPAPAVDAEALEQPLIAAEPEAPPSAPSSEVPVEEAFVRATEADIGAGSSELREVASQFAKLSDEASRFGLDVAEDAPPAVDDNALAEASKTSASATARARPGFTRVRVTGGGFCYLGRVYENGSVLDAPNTDVTNHPALLIPIE